MRIAWFRHADADAANPLDSTAAVIDELRATHDIDIIVETAAHDFVWQHLRRPWELCVFELDNMRTHFIWGYLANYPGVTLLHSLEVTNLRVAVLASRAVVVGDAGLAERLQVRFPDAHVRYAPACAGPESSAHKMERGADRSRVRSHDAAEAAGGRPVTFAVFDARTARRNLVDRAFERAREAGAIFEVLERDRPLSALARGDVVIAPAWPPFHTPSTPLLAALAAGKPVVTMETEATAEWPAIDPQTWRPRDLAASQAPIAVTVDPRDEEHSLMLAIRRLSADAALRDQLGRAARAWWETQATPARAASRWDAILQEAATLSPPRRPADWPRQFLTDGTALARGILGEFGVTSDL